MEALFELAADAIDCTDQREAWIPILEQILIDDGRHQHDQRTAPYTVGDARKTEFLPRRCALTILRFFVYVLYFHQPASFAGYS